MSKRGIGGLIESLATAMLTAAFMLLTFVFWLMVRAIRLITRVLKTYPHAWALWTLLGLGIASSVGVLLAFEVPFSPPIAGFFDTLAAVSWGTLVVSCKLVELADPKRLPDKVNSVYQALHRPWWEE